VSKVSTVRSKRPAGSGGRAMEVASPDIFSSQSTSPPFTSRRNRSMARLGVDVPKRTAASICTGLCVPEAVVVRIA